MAASFSFEFATHAFLLFPGYVILVFLSNLRYQFKLILILEF